MKMTYALKARRGWAERNGHTERTDGRDGTMNAHERVEWLNERDPLHEWRVGQDVFCLHCDGVFKAEAVGEDTDGLPECPNCGATPLDFHPTPWWRD